MRLASNLVLALALVACSADDAPGANCTTDACVETCEPESGAARGGCPPGHQCVVDTAGSYCDPECQDSLCEARSECGPDGACSIRPDHCGRTIPCIATDQICDPEADKCFPRNGDCSSTLGCPDFSTAFRRVADTTCSDKDKLCHVTKLSEGSTWLATGQDVVVTTPEPGSLASGSDLGFGWINLGLPMLLRVLSTPPTEPSEFDRQVIWGASATRQASSVRWSAGYRVESGAWQHTSPAPLSDGVYYFLAIAVRDGARAAVSPPIPFYVGDVAPWKQVGDACSLPGIPGDCESPSLPLTCYDNVCRRLCASHVECAPSRCGDTLAGARFCE